MRLISDLLVHAIDDAQCSHDTPVVSASSIEDDHVAALEVSKDGPANVDLSDCVPVGLLFNEFSR